jgi:vesicle-fusing ATPase
MDMSDAFNSDLYIPNISDLSSVQKIVTELKLFNDSEYEQAMSLMVRSGLSDKLNIGIKKMMMITEMARQDEDKVEKLVACL